MELFTTLFTGMWVLVGILLFTIGLVLGRNGEAQEEDFQVETNGTVIDMRFITGERGGAWHPVFGFYVDGEYITQISPFGGKHSAFEIGEEVIVHYDPSNPSEYYIPQEPPDQTLIHGFQAAGIICISIGVLVGVFLTLFL